MREGRKGGVVVHMNRPTNDNERSYRWWILLTSYATWASTVPKCFSKNPSRIKQIADLLITRYNQNTMASHDEESQLVQHMDTFHHFQNAHRELGISKFNIKKNRQPKIYHLHQLSATRTRLQHWKKGKRTKPRKWIYFINSMNFCGWSKWIMIYN